MKALYRYAGFKTAGHEKESTNKRSYAVAGSDKTRGQRSRKIMKERIRNDNRAITKKARSLLKRQMLDEATDT